MTIPVVDIFAGPGGLNEGFASAETARNRRIFKTVASIEMDPVACSTLILRSAFRFAKDGNANMDPYFEMLRGERTLDDLRLVQDFDEAFVHAEHEIHELELGADTRTLSDRKIKLALKSSGSDSPWVLIGGPPCQAYSLAGRSRRKNDETFMDDKKHFLYQEYLHIIRKFRPTVFVMENVKGLLSSTNSGTGMFDLILNDLAGTKTGHRYDIHSLVVESEEGEYSPTDFVIKSENFGVPQRRHRVILLGILRSSGLNAKSFRRLTTKGMVTTSRAIGDLPKIRSGISRFSGDDSERWLAIRTESDQESSKALGTPLHNFSATKLNRGSPFIRSRNSSRSPKQGDSFADWIFDPNIGGVVQHEARAHMESDLHRYFFAAAYAKLNHESPKLRDFPTKLLPNHANAISASRPFEDRFRVQLANGPATTIVSHIAKDGHYYIHPDPLQMRSLTVREAARLQTFPDNYFFCGNRTQQYHQVGNAVPPLLAHQIAEIVAEILG